MEKKLILIILLIFSNLSYCNVKKNNIPIRAYDYLPILYKEIGIYLPSFPIYGYFGALIEHESCTSLYNKRCWSPKSRLKTKREEGAGLGQLTRAYRKDGSIRFDTINTLRKKYVHDLKDLTWENVYNRPDLQIKAILLLYKENYDRIQLIRTDKLSILAMSDAAYNGGIRDVFRERRICGMTKNCNPNKWFNNIENTCIKSRRILYGNRNACDINRYHVRDIILTRMYKYQLDYIYRE